MLTFVANPAFVGQATVQFTLSNAFATSAAASVTFTVAPRLTRVWMRKCVA